MAFRSDFEDIVYPDESGKPCALRYRLAFVSTTRLQVVVHLVHDDEAFESPARSSIVRDQLLNRILNNRLAGIPLNAIRLVVTDSRGSFEFPIEVDVEDYLSRGNRYEAGQIRSDRMRVLEKISIRSEDIIAGRTRVQTTHAKPTDPPAEVVSIIA
jgi:hypothetical protein